MPGRSSACGSPIAFKVNQSGVRSVNAPQPRAMTHAISFRSLLRLQLGCAYLHVCLLLLLSSTTAVPKGAQEKPDDAADYPNSQW
jgi:hypothetical protein